MNLIRPNAALLNLTSQLFLDPPIKDYRGGWFNGSDILQVIRGKCTNKEAYSQDQKSHDQEKSLGMLRSYIITGLICMF